MESQMKIHAHILAYNEALIMPFLLDYYSRYCEKIFIYDNMSDDGSFEIYQQYSRVEVASFDTSNQFDEKTLVTIRNNGYKTSRAKGVDWVIVCDADEFLYHPDLLGVLQYYKQAKITTPLVQGYHMASQSFPKYDGQLLTTKIKHGIIAGPRFNKQIIFHPDLDIDFGPGSHSYHCDKAVSSAEYELKLLHYKYLGEDYLAAKHERLFQRISDDSKINGYGIQYGLGIPQRYHLILEQGFKVIE